MRFALTGWDFDVIWLCKYLQRISGENSCDETRQHVGRETTSAAKNAVRKISRRKGRNKKGKTVVRRGA